MTPSISLSVGRAATIPSSTRATISSISVRTIRLRVADVAPGACTAIGDVKLAAAMATSKKAGEQRLATSHRAAAHEALTIGVVGDQALIPFELGPANVAFVTVDDQSLPLAPLLAESAHDPFAAPIDLMRLPVRPNA